MCDEGYEAMGIELDPRAKMFAASVYALADDNVVVGDVRGWADRAASADRRWDIVSCLA